MSVVAVANRWPLICLLEVPQATDVAVAAAIANLSH
jgi:hypothetical protein